MEVLEVQERSGSRRRALAEVWDTFRCGPSPPAAGSRVSRLHTAFPSRHTEPRALSGHGRRDSAGHRAGRDGPRSAQPGGHSGQRGGGDTDPGADPGTDPGADPGADSDTDPGADPGPARAPRDVSRDAMGAALAAHVGADVTAAGGPAAGEARRARAAAGGCPGPMAQSGGCARGSAEGTRHGPGPACPSGRPPAGLQAQPGCPGPAGDPALTAGPSRGDQAQAAPSALCRAGGGF
ncbi:cuticle collagen 13-like [Sylvia atricapilla]|uniref:cuticle collagen 13-like n=1 Tax=Sylvia atricapilla TaxID=48155 RepID=UPI003397ADBE